MPSNAEEGTLAIKAEYGLVKVLLLETGEHLTFTSDGARMLSQVLDMTADEADAQVPSRRRKKKP